MKNFISIICALIISIGYARAQDIIICRNGDEIESKILKISKTEIEYKKWSNQDGPTYTLEKSEVFMIKYPNGDKDLFKETPAKQDDANKETTAENNEEETEEYSQPIVATAAADNAELIAQYNTDISGALNEYYKENKPKKGPNTIFFRLNATTSSIFSTDDIEILITPIAIKNYFAGESIGTIVNSNPDYYTDWYRLKYAIVIKNKTSRIIYIDKAACFGNSSDGKTKTYFDPTEYTVTKGGNSSTGASVNLGSVADALGVGGVVGTLAGGVTVGGNKGKATITTTTQRDNRILTIPPQASVTLSEDKAIKHPSDNRKYIITGSYEYHSHNPFSKSLSKKEPHIKYSEENCPQTIKYMVTYSFDKNLRKSYMVNFGVYISDLFLLHSHRHIKHILKNYPRSIFIGHY